MLVSLHRGRQTNRRPLRPGVNPMPLLTETRNLPQAAYCRKIKTGEVKMKMRLNEKNL